MWFILSHCLYIYQPPTTVLIFTPINKWSVTINYMAKSKSKWFLLQAQTSKGRSLESSLTAPTPAFRSAHPMDGPHLS
jgi:hypothetical protein